MRASLQTEENHNRKVHTITLIIVRYESKHFLPSRGQSPTLSQTITWQATSSVHCSHLLSLLISQKEREGADSLHWNGCYKDSKDDVVVGLSRPAGAQQQGKTTKGDGLRSAGGMEMIAAWAGCCSTAAAFYIIRTVSHFQPLDFVVSLFLK